MNPVAIIGGGITGLTAAFRLSERKVPVTLYEASGRVGGVIQTVRKDGYLAEFGPNSILETSPRIPSLIHDLGLESRRLYSDPGAENRYLVRGGKPKATSTVVRGDGEKEKDWRKRGEGKEKGKNLAIVRKKTAKKQETIKKTAPAKVLKKAVPAIPAKGAKKVASAASAGSVEKQSGEAHQVETRPA
jgi:phytoene dehydrogenase-like protein